MHRRRGMGRVRRRGKRTVRRMGRRTERRMDRQGVDILNSNKIYHNFTKALPTGQPRI